MSPLRPASGSLSRAALALLSLAVLAPAPAPAADISWVPGKRMVDAVARVMGSVRKLSDKSLYGYDDDVSVMAAFLASGKEVSFQRTLRGGKKYVILGGGDKYVEDLDIEVLDSGGEVVAKDTDTDPSPVVAFTPPRTGTYTIRQRLYKADAKTGGFCVVAVLREGGYDVPISNLSSALASVIGQCEEIDRKTSKSVYFHDGANQWAILGGVVKQGESLTINKLSLGLGQRVIVAGGDATAQDIDLYLLDDDGKVVLKDEDPDATPRLAFRVHRRDYNGIRIKNVKSRGPSLVLAAMLRIED